MPVITIPLNTGCHEETDQRLMTDGRLRTVRNGRLDREGRLRVRAGYTAVASAIYNVNGPSLVAYDLATYRGRMVALGDVSIDPSGYPTALYDFIDGARPWRQVQPNGQKIPRLTGMRELIGSSGSTGAILHASGAAMGNVLMAYGLTSDIPRVMFTQVSTGRVLFTDDLDEGSGHASFNPKACETDQRIIVAGKDTTQRFIYGYTVEPDTRFMSQASIATALIDAGGGNTITPTWAIGRVANTEGFVIAAELSTGSVVVRRFTNAGVVVVPSGGQYGDIVANPTFIAVEADLTSNTVNVAMIVGGQTRLKTYNLTTGAEVGVGPHVSSGMGADTATSVYLTRASATSVIVSGDVTHTDANRVANESYNPATNAFGSVCRLEDARLRAAPAWQGGQLIAAIHHNGAVSTGPVLVVAVTLTTAATDVTLLASVDLDLWGNSLGRIFEDTSTGIWYWDRSYSLGTVDVSRRAVVSEFMLDSTERRQMVEVGNVLYLAGGLPLAYDGVSCVEMSFADHPRIISLTPSNSTGTLDSDVTYTYGYHYQAIDARGNVIFSSVADPLEVTMGVADDTVTFIVSRPYSLRTNLGSATWGGATTGPIFRNTVDDVDGNPTPSSLLQWIEIAPTASASFAQADPVSDADILPDSSLEDNLVIYTQSQTIFDNRPPPPCRFVGFDGNRMMVAGTPRAERWRASKPLETESQIAFPRDGSLAFQGSLPSDIETVVAYANSWLLVTRRDMWTINGQGPNVAGVGEFQSPYRIPSDGGMRPGGWTSVVVFGKGVMFQLEDDQLYLWSGGTPELVGLEIQDTLEAFPNVVAACHIAKQQAVVLALQNDAGTDGCLAIWDQQSGQWFRDDVGVVTSICEHDGKLAYIQAGVVYLEDDDYGTGAAVPLTIATSNVAKTGAAGASGIQLVHLVGVFQDECTAELRIKYQDESTFSSIGTKTLNVANGYAEGSPFDLEWQPPRDDGSRYELELVVTSDSANTKLAWLNAIEVHYDIDDGPTRVGDARRR